MDERAKERELARLGYVRRGRTRYWLQGVNNDMFIILLRAGSISERRGDDSLGPVIGLDQALEYARQHPAEPLKEEA